jgi:hypothetical protein
MSAKACFMYPDVLALKTEPGYQGGSEGIFSWIPVVIGGQNTYHLLVYDQLIAVMYWLGTYSLYMG